MNTPPTIKTSGISVETGALLANMEFYNLKLTNEDSSNGYVVNIDQKCTIQKLTFEKCTISKLRGVFRAQKLESNGGLAATIGNILLFKILVIMELLTPMKIYPKNRKMQNITH